MKDYYRILGLSFGASKDEIATTCRRIAHEHEAGKGRLSRDVREAYGVLCSESNRAKYDIDYAEHLIPQNPIAEKRKAATPTQKSRQSAYRTTRRVGFVDGKSGFLGLQRKIWSLIVIFLILTVSVMAIVFFRDMEAEERKEDAVREGLEKFSHGEFQEAAELLEQGSEDAQEFDVLLKLGASYYNQRKYDEAIETYEKAIALENGSAVAYNSLGNVYRDRKNAENAIESYRKAIELDPDFPLSYSNLAILLMDLGEPVEAQRVLDEGMARIPDSRELENIASYVGR